jgi:hypothetical protein
MFNVYKIFRKYTQMFCLYPKYSMFSMKFLLQPKEQPTHPNEHISFTFVVSYISRAWESFTVL